MVAQVYLTEVLRSTPMQAKTCSCLMIRDKALTSDLLARNKMKVIRGSPYGSVRDLNSPCYLKPACTIVSA